MAIVAPSRSCGFLKRESSGRREHPADLAEALLRVDEIGDRHERRRRGEAALVLGDPVLAGEPAVEHAVGHVARHFLRANQHALDLGIVDRRKVRARADVDREPGAREELHGRVLQRSLRKTQLECAHVGSALSSRLCQFAEEACARAGVADVAVAEPLHFQQHRVVVAVDENLLDGELVARTSRPSSRASVASG